MRTPDIERIMAIIEEEKPKFTIYGGNIEFMDIKDDMVRIRPSGYCYR